MKCLEMIMLYGPFACFNFQACNGIWPTLILAFSANGSNYPYDVLVNKLEIQLIKIYWLIFLHSNQQFMTGFNICDLSSGIISNLLMFTSNFHYNLN